MRTVKPILQSIAESGHYFPYISKITPADKALLYETVQQVRHASKYYEDSWGYIIQATRDGQCKWYDPRNGALIFFGRKPHSAELVVPLFFAEPAYLRNVLMQIQRVLAIKQSIVKNANPQEVTPLLAVGFRKYAQGEAWSIEAPFDDQTYPQLIVDLQKLAQAKGRKYHLLRKALNKRPNITLRAYQDEDKQAVLAIFRAVDKSHGLLPNEGGGYFEAHAMYPDSETDRYTILDEKNNVVGFTATSDISPRIVAFVASLFRPGAKHVSTWATYQTLITKYRQGFRFASLGGCESKNTYIFKKEKFQPIAELPKTHLVFDLQR